MQSAGVTKDKTRRPATRRTGVKRSGDDICRLGEALNARSADVVALTVARTAESGVRDAEVMNLPSLKAGVSLTPLRA
jgi:hypothetical protein